MIKMVSLFNMLFQFRPESQSASLPYLGVDGLKSATTSPSLFNRSLD